MKVLRICFWLVCGIVFLLILIFIGYLLAAFIPYVVPTGALAF